MKSWTRITAALAGAILLAVFATTTPAPVADKDADATEFSAERAMADVREIARAPHPTGSAENARVRAWLVRRLESLGMTVTTSAAPLGEEGKARLDKWRGSEAPAPEAVNIVATFGEPASTKPAVLLMAHHDSVWGSPGAADDAAGVAAILETVRAIGAARIPGKDKLMVLFTDAEELGLDGARHFFGNDPARARVGVVVNLEARGGGGRASMFETGDANGAMIALFAREVRHPVATSLSTFVYKKLPNNTDYTLAKDKGVPGFNFAFIGRPGLYHSPLATPDALDQGSLQDIGRQTLDLTRGLLQADPLPGKAPDMVFYDLFGMVFLAYPAWAGWLILAVTALAWGYAAWHRTTLRDLARGTGAALAVFALGAILLFLGNLASGADGKVNYYDRLAAIQHLEVQAVLLCLAATLLAAGLLLARRPLAPLLPGLALPFLLLAVAAQAAAPTAAFPLQIPLLLGGLGAAAMRWKGEAGAWAAAIAAAIGVGYLLTLGHALFQAMGPEMPFLLALPLALGVLLVLPIVPAVERKPALQSAAALAASALLMALLVRFDAVAPSVAVYSSFR